MSFVDFPVYNLLDDNLLVPNEDIGKEIDLLIILRSTDYQGKYVNNLSQLIKAIKLNEPEDVKLCLLSNKESIHLKEWSRAYNFKHCITFGLSMSDVSLNIQFQKYKLCNFENYQLLQVDSLSIVMEDQGMKKALWGKLKEMYKM